MDIASKHNSVAAHLIDYVENNRTDQAAGIMTVPASAYTDPDMWAREMELIFRRVPILAAISAEMPNPGDYKAAEILGKPLLITRLKDGSVRAMLNVCPHRSMLIATEGAGNCSRFSCPYHGWTFANDGRLIGVADAQKFGDLDKTVNGLTQLPAHERGGLIFVVLTPGLEVDFDAYLGGMIADIEQLGFRDWHYCGSREIFGANWKVAYDGYLEGYHFAAAHPTTIHPRTFSNVMHFEAYGPHLLIGFPQLTIAELRDTPKQDLWRLENKGYDFIRTLFPNVSIFVAPELTQIAQLIPGPTAAENRTVLHFITRTPPANDAEKAQTEEMIDWLRGVVDREDYMVGLKIQKGLESGAFDKVILGKNERGNQYFHKWVAWYLANDPTLPKPEL